MISGPFDCEQTIGAPTPRYLRSSRPLLSRSAALLLLVVIAGSAFAEDMVTIPKSRLEELERKEAELEKIKGEFSKTKDQNVKLQKQHEADAVKIAAAPPAQPVVTHVSPPMASLPPLQPGETVDAMDLAGHYRADPKAADERYRKKIFLVRGEVVGFDKPMLRSDYKILLNSGDRELQVVCDIDPPEKYSAVFTTRNGVELVGLLGGTTRVPLVKKGDTAVVVGKCRGMRNSVVTLTECQLGVVTAH